MSLGMADTATTVTPTFATTTGQTMTTDQIRGTKIGMTIGQTRDTTRGTATALMTEVRICLVFQKCFKIKYFATRRQVRRLRSTGRMVSRRTSR